MQPSPFWFRWPKAPVAHTGKLPPVLFRLFLFLLHEAVLVLFVFIDLFGRFQLQRVRADDLQIRAALVATDRVAFVDIFFIHVDTTFAGRTSDHQIEPPEYFTVIRYLPAIATPISASISYYGWAVDPIS